MNRAMNGKQMMKCGGKAHGKKYKSGGKVRGCGVAKRGTKKAKMY